MLNFGLADLRLVAPRDGWPNPAAGPAASGADRVLADARVFATVRRPSPIAATCWRPPFAGAT
jgi:tRNA C32,U32 (ribose-2'-O)-methylase TrmJ